MNFNRKVLEGGRFSCFCFSMNCFSFKIHFADKQMTEMQVFMFSFQTK